MPNEKRPQTTPPMAWDSTSGKTDSARDDDEIPTNPPTPPNSPSITSPPRISKTPASTPEPPSSPGISLRRRGCPLFRLSFLDQLTDVDLVAVIFTDPSHVSFATYSTTHPPLPTSANPVSEFCPSDSRAPTSETSRSQTPAAALNPDRDSDDEQIDHDGDNDDDGESDAPPPTPPESCYYELNSIVECNQIALSLQKTRGKKRLSER
jgi:hypothetical protein